MLKSIIKYLLYLCAFVSTIMLLPGSILLDIHPKAFYYALPKGFSGPLKANERLAEASILFEGELAGPESIGVFNGKIVTGSADGFLYQIDGDLLKPLLKLVDKSCVTHRYNTTKCGRPLGLKFDSKGTLFVVEPSVGVFSVDNVFGKNPKVSLVFDIDQTAVLGKASKFLDDLAIDEGAGLNGGDVLYISDVSVKFDIYQCNLIIFGSDMGRLIKYDINAKKVESIAENLLFPNGVELTDDKTAVLVNEFLSRQIDKVYIKGPKKGQLEVLVKHLPGEIDNIRRSASKKETYWVSVLTARTAGKPNDLDYYMKKPLLRKLACRLVYLIGSGIEFVGSIFNNDLVKEFGIDMKNGREFNGLIFNDKSQNYGMIIEIDSSGQIVDSLHASDLSLTRLSEVREVRINEKQTVLYLGSYANNHLGKLILNR